MSDEALDWMVEDEIAAFEDDYEAEEPSTPTGMSEEEAEIHLRVLKYQQFKRSQIEAVYKRELERLEVKFQAATRPFDRAIKYHTDSLIGFSRELGKSYKGLNGTVKRVSGREKVICDDAEAQAKFYAWAKEAGKLDELTRVVPETWHVDKRKLLKFVKTTSELPPGVDLERGDDSFSIDLS